MEKIQNWAFSLCCASIAGSILNMIVPEGNLQKTFKTILCVFFLCVFVSPIMKTDFDFRDISIKSNMENEYDFSENIFLGDSSGIIEKEIISETKNILEKYEIIGGEIIVNANISDNGSIDITEFTVLLSEYGNIQEIEETIFEKTGIRPDIIVSGENEDG